ncbi:MAG: hypothetical protein KIG62_11035, partial [Oscillospiraceae bacterium]|nr:hypothetical protein [Oscillospiraceae bacterium]
MSRVLKANRYRMVANNAFEMPLPLKFRIMKKNCPVAEYEISADESVSFCVLTKYKEDMITPLHRRLGIADIYYLFSCRVFQDKTPFTAQQLGLLGLSRYNVYDILLKTRGITPFDSYWIKFDGDSCDYEKALEMFNELTGEKEEPPAPLPVFGNTYLPNQAIEALFEQRENILAEKEPEQSELISEILSQHTVDISAIDRGSALGEASAQGEAASSDSGADDFYSEMSLGEIESLLTSLGLNEDTAAPEPAPEPSGGKLTQEQIEAMMNAARGEDEAAPAPVPAQSGGKLTQEQIEG